MLTAAQVRRIALALPEAEEKPHHGFPSFRVRDRIFATLPDAHHLNIMLSGDDALLASQHASGACHALHWGQRLAGVQVELARAPRDIVADLLREAWTQKAPKRLHPRR